MTVGVESLRTGQPCGTAGTREPPLHGDPPSFPERLGHEWATGGALLASLMLPRSGVVGSPGGRRTSKLHRAMS
jgi:hypothetical protein